MFADDLAYLKSIGAREAQNVAEAEELCKFIASVQPKVYLEIGARHGWTFYLVSKVLKPGATMIAIDLPGVHPWGDAGSEEVLQRVINEVNAAGINAVFINADSQSKETASKIDKDVDFLFIDGDHRYEGVSIDYGIYRPKVKRGHIAFHDIHAKPKQDKTKLIEVPRFWSEIRGARHSIEIGSNPGIGILCID